MRNSSHFLYLVEGECEKKLIEVFKSQKEMIQAGKVEKFNVVQETLNDTRLRTIIRGTTVILVFDTDTDSIDILLRNLNSLKTHPHIKAVWCITQVDNLEDEFIRSTDIKEIKELLGSPSNKEFKHFMIKEKNLFDKLSKHHFDYSLFWNTQPRGIFVQFKNEGYRVKA